MSVQSFIANLKTKPEHTRKKFAFWSSLGITAVIFVFWLGSFSVSNFKVSGNVITKTVEKINTPSQSIIAAAGSMFGNIKDLLFGPKKVTFTSIQVEPGNNKTSKVRH